MFHVQTLRKNKTIKNVIQYLCHIRKKIEMLTFKLIGISLTFKKKKTGFLATRSFRTYSKILH